jgi:hypothetical protein
VNDAVGGTGVQSEAGAAGDERALRGALAWAPGTPIPAGTLAGRAVHGDGQVGVDVEDGLLTGLAADPVDVRTDGSGGGAGQQHSAGDWDAFGSRPPGRAGRPEGPSEASEESFSCGVPPVPRFAPPLLPATASVMPIATAITTTAAPIPATQLRRRLRRASRARILVIFSRACCLFLLPLDTACAPQFDRSPNDRWVNWAGRRRCGPRRGPPPARPRCAGPCRSLRSS